MNKDNPHTEIRSNLFAPHGYNSPIWIIAFLVAIITFIIYLPALQNGFVNWDDPVLVYENTNIRSINLQFLSWALIDVTTGLWHPMLWFSFAFDYAVWGLNPKGYHLTNVIFHTGRAVARTPL